MEQDRANNRHSKGFEKHNQSKRVGVGLLLLTVGVLFILKNLDVFSPAVEDILISWQMLLIGIGFVKMISDNNKAIGGILIVVGGFFMVPELWDVSVDFVDVFWPILLVAAGVLVIAGPGKNFFNKKRKIFSSDENFIEEVNIFGGNEKTISTQKFKGGSIQNIFGGTELDMRDCEMEGDRAEIDLVCVFGGMELRVPDHWDVVIKVAPIFGGFSNKRVIRVAEGTSRKVLFIKGIVVFGGGEIK